VAGLIGNSTSVNVSERSEECSLWDSWPYIGLAEEAFYKAVDALENEIEVPFSKRKEELKTGRTIN